jgi:hypothetical protein
MRKKYFYIIAIVLVFAIFYKLNPTRTKETYLKYLSKQKFYSKLKNISSWVNNQIEKDLIFAKENKITLDALDETYRAMRENFPEAKNEFIRYRIVNNTLYHFFPEKRASKKEGTLEKALKTLLCLRKIEDVDFIFCNIDGLPSAKNTDGVLFYYEDKRDFYLVKDEKLQAPIFTRAKHQNVKEGILLPDYFVLSELWLKMQKEVLALNDKYLWQDKKDLAFWRGASSKTPRFKLCEMSLSNKDLVDAGFVDELNERKIQELKKWNKLDNYSSLQRPYANLQEQLNYKYLPVLDGIMCTYPGYYWRLLSNSIVFKQASDELQWFYLALVPYEHYIPIKKDISDLISQIKWAQKNDDKCKKIIKNATDFILDNLMIEDAYVYLYEVLQNYAKYQDFDTKDLRKDLKKDKRWIAISNRKKANKILKKQKYDFF